MPLTTIPFYPNIVQDNINGKQGSIWMGETTDSLPGTVSPWKDVAVGSLYIDVTGGTATIFVRKLATNAVASWGTVTVG